jgi:hypothetical protein
LATGAGVALAGSQALKNLGMIGGAGNIANAANATNAATAAASGLDIFGNLLLI